MADNVTADAAVTVGSTFVTANFTFSGDSAHAPGCFQGILSGSEGSWTYTLYVGGAGAVTAGTQRMTLASDDPAVAALQIMDDWDETDRAKVNLIVGQAGIAAGAGAVGVTVPRVTLASDDPAVTALQLLDNAISGAGFNITQLGGVNVTMGSGVTGTGVQRVVLATDVALPAGTNAIGKLAANSGVDIGDVDVTSVIPGTGATNLGKAIDTATGATDTGVLTLATRDDALSALTPIEGDNVQLRVDANGALWVIVSGTVTVGSHAVTNAGTFVVQENGAALTALQLIDDTVATTASAITAKGIAAAGTDGTNARILKTDTSGELQIDVLTIAAGDNNIGNVDIVSLPASTNTLEVVGDAAHDAAIAGNPVRLGGRALTSDYAAVATGDTADLISSILGKLVTLPYAIPGQTWSYASPAAVTDTADDEAKAAGAAGVRHYICSVQVFNADDTVGTEVVLKDGATVLWRGWAEQTGGGCSARFDPPLRGTAATAVNVANITTSAETYFNLQGFSASE